MMRSQPLSVICILMACLSLMMLPLRQPSAVLAAPLQPGDFTSLGELVLAPGAYTVDTTALTLTGPGVSITGAESGGIAVFVFTSVVITTGVTLKASGTRPLALLSQGDMLVAGVIDGSGSSSGTNFSGGSGAPGGPGGGAGGASSPNSMQSPSGSGPGGGVGANNKAGASGGGFGGAGARGATVDEQTGGAGGIAYGDLRSLLQGGSGGGGAWSTQGAGGGGGLELGSIGVLQIAPTGTVQANGGDAAVGGKGAPGGGSGGGILLHAPSLVLEGNVQANGGQGGRGSCCGAGGGGGGGRIVIVAGDTTNNGTLSVAGGTSGTAFKGGCAGGTCSPGTPSPDPTGAAGQIAGGESIRAADGDLQSAQIATAFSNNLRVVVRNPFGQPVPGVDVVFTAPSSGPGGTFGGTNTVIATTDLNGIASAPTLTANPLPGSFTATASAISLGIATRFTLMATVGPPGTITSIGGVEQSTMVATDFSQPLRTLVRDSFGNVLSGIAVTFSAPTGDPSAHFSRAISVTTTTDSSGIATAPTLTAGEASGTFTVTASTSGVVSPAYFRLTATPGAATQVTTAGNDQRTLMGTSFADQLVVTVLDRFGNAIPGVAVTFTAPVSGPGGSFSGSRSITQTTDTDGTATAPPFQANSLVGRYDVTATVAGLEEAVVFHLANEMRVYLPLVDCTRFYCREENG